MLERLFGNSSVVARCVQTRQDLVCNIERGVGSRALCRCPVDLHDIQAPSAVGWAVVPANAQYVVLAAACCRNGQ